MGGTLQEIRSDKDSCVRMRIVAFAFEGDLKEAQRIPLENRNNIGGTV